MAQVRFLDQVPIGVFQSNPINIFPYEGDVEIIGSLDVTKFITTNIFLNKQVISENLDLPEGYNGFIMGPVEIASDITIPTDSVLTILGDLSNVAITNNENTFNDVQTFASSINIISSSYGYNEIQNATNGTQDIALIDAQIYTTAFFDYTLTDGNNSRAGTITALWNNITNTITYRENNKVNIGNTADLLWVVILHNNLIKLQAIISNSSWDIKTTTKTL